MVFDPRDAMLYIADTGNARIAKLDTKSGTPGKNVQPLEPMKTCQMMDGTALVDVVASGTGELTLPSGLEMKGDLLYVSDNANGRISVFTREGKRVNYLDTGLPAGALAGMAFGPDGKLYFVDGTDSRVLRIDPKPATK
jgi:sugar lactone lactonase YvrE